MIGKPVLVSLPRQVRVFLRQLPAEVVREQTRDEHCGAGLGHALASVLGVDDEDQPALAGPFDVVEHVAPELGVCPVHSFTGVERSE